MNQKDMRTPEIIKKIFYEDKELFSHLMIELRGMVLESSEFPELGSRKK